MRRSFILSIILAASVAMFGACSGTTTNVPNKPVATPVPVQPASPISSPSATPIGSPAKPVASPAKPTTSPEVKKPDGKDAVKEVKPNTTASPKTK